MSTEVQSSPRSIPVAFLLLVHAVILAVRDALAPVINPDNLAATVLGGELAAARALLVPFSAPLPDGTPTPRYKTAIAAVLGAIDGASTYGHEKPIAAVLGAIDGASTYGHEKPPRRFHGEVALKGHRNLGMCLVEEQRLGGVQVIRCTRLCVDPPEVHWTRADNVYDLREVHEDEDIDEECHEHLTVVRHDRGGASR